MTFRLENSSGFKSVRLWNGQQLGRSFDADEQIFAPAATDETVLSVLSDQGRVTLDGITVGKQRITAGTTAKTDPVAAVAEWVADFEAWVNSARPNAGFTLRNTDTGRRTNVTPRSLNWTQSSGEYQSVQYGIEFEIGGDLGGDLGINPATVSPGGTDSFDGIDLPGIIERRVEKDVPIDVDAKLLDESNENNNVFQTAGAVKRITLQGQVDKTLAEMETFDDRFEDRTGDGETYRFESAFPGESLDAAILSYESTREAGLTQRGEYVLELVTGSVI